MQKTVLVTGGAGYIGSQVVRELLKQDHKVIVVDNLSSGKLEFVPASVFVVELDLAHFEGLKKVFQEHKVDTVLHFAGSIEAGLSMEQPRDFFMNNTANTANLLEAMRLEGVKKIVFSSTAAVYGNPLEIPLKEESLGVPTNFYGFTKKASEDLIQTYERMYGFQSVILRYFNAAGADVSGQYGEFHEPETHLLPNLLLYLLGKKQTFDLFGLDYDTPDGTCVRDYIHVLDLASAHVLSVDFLEQQNKSEIFNLGNGAGFSVLEVIRAAEKVTGKKVDFTVKPRRAGDPAVLVADSTKAQRMLGWKPQFASIEKIVEDAWRWHGRLS